MQFFDVPDDTGGASEPSQSATSILEGSPEPAVQNPEPAPAAPAFDAKALATEFGSVLRDTLGQQKQAEPAKPPMTPEEAKKLLNFFEIDDDFMKDFGDLEKQKPTLEKFRDGVVKHLDTVMQMRMQEMRQAIEAQYNPVVTEFQAQQQLAAETRFNTKYTELAKPELKPLLQAVSGSLVQQGKKFSSESEAFEALAKGVEAVIQQTNPQFKLASVSADGQQNKQKSSSSIPVTTPGGGGGGGGGGNSSGLKGALGILGPVKG